MKKLTVCVCNRALLYHLPQGDLGKVCFYMLHSMAHSIDFDDKSSNGRVVYHANVKFEPNMIVKNMTCDIVNAATKISLPVSFCKLFCIEKCTCIIMLSIVCGLIIIIYNSDIIIIDTRDYKIIDTQPRQPLIVAR